MVVPALLACRSILLFNISSSLRRVRASSASSRPSLTLAILARKASTDSEPSLLAVMVTRRANRIVILSRERNIAAHVVSVVDMDQSKGIAELVNNYGDTGVVLTEKAA